jgi:hypothetical protein
MRGVATEEVEPASAERSGRRVRLGWPLGVLAAVVVANVLPLLGIVNVDPLVPVGRTGLVGKGGFLPGEPFTDNYAGWTSQALGHLAAVDWLHGTVPWWNPLEGLGVPLLAEMQSAAFFPPNLLLALPQGQLYLHLVLQSIAGLATWCLLRELGFGPATAGCGGILFALNGTFCWLTGSPQDPVAFLPVMLLGVERLSRRESFDAGGFFILVIGVSLSIYAGFPETTYFELVFAFIWFVFRFARHPRGGRGRFALHTGLGGAVGLMLAAPIVIPFLGYLPIAYLGPNVGGFASAHLPGVATSSIGLPYLLGPIRAFEPTHLLKATWVGVGGFVSAPLLALSFVGFVGAKRQAGLRWLLAVTAGLILIWSFGAPVVHSVLEHVLPAVRDDEYYRYAAPIWELCFVLLACFGIEVVANRDGRGRQLAIAGGGLAALLVVACEILISWSTISYLDRSAASYRPWPLLMATWAVGSVLVMTVAGLALRRGPRAGHLPRESGSRPPGLCRAAAGIVGGLVVLDAVVMFIVPQLSAPRSVRLDSGPAAYLAAHLGNGRFFSISVYAPNYGSYFRLASLDVDDVPLPKLWTQYVASHLAPGTTPSFIFGWPTGLAGDTPPEVVDHLLDDLPAYEAVDVRYVLVPSYLHLSGRGPGFEDGLSIVYSDNEMTIYALPHPKPFFRTSGAPCSITAPSRDELVASCVAPARLVRAELAFPGWSATVNGHGVPIVAVDGGLSSIELPAGRSEVSFSYFPSHEGAGLGVFVLGLLCALGIPLFASRRRRGTHLCSPPAGGEGGTQRRAPPPSDNDARTTASSRGWVSVGRRRCVP